MNKPDYLTLEGLTKISRKKSSKRFVTFLTKVVDMDTGDTRAHEIMMHNQSVPGLSNVVWKRLNAEQSSHVALTENYHGNTVIDYMQNPQFASGRMQDFSDILLRKPRGDEALHGITAEYCQMRSSNLNHSDVLAMQAAKNTNNLAAKLEILARRHSGIATAASLAKRFVGTVPSPSYHHVGLPRTNISPMDFPTECAF